MKKVKYNKFEKQSPYKEVWLHEGDKERYLEIRENIRNGIKQSRSRAKKQNDT